MHLVLQDISGIDLSNVAALKRGATGFAEYYAQRLCVTLAKLLEKTPDLHLTGWDGDVLERVEVDPRLEVLWPAAFNGSDKEFRAQYTHPLGNVRMDCDPMTMNTGPTIQLGPIEVIGLYVSDQLAVEPGDAVSCLGFSARMPNDGRRGSFSFGRTREGTYFLSLFERQSLIDDGDPCAILIGK